MYWILHLHQWFCTGGYFYPLDSWQCLETFLSHWPGGGGRRKVLLTSSGLKPRVLLNALKHISTHYNKKTPSLKCHMQRLRNPDLDDQMFLEQKYQVNNPPVKFCSGICKIKRAARMCVAEWIWCVCVWGGAVEREDLNVNINHKQFTREQNKKLEEKVVVTWTEDSPTFPMEIGKGWQTLLWETILFWHMIIAFIM